MQNTSMVDILAFVIFFVYSSKYLCSSRNSGLWEYYGRQPWLGGKRCRIL